MDASQVTKHHTTRVATLVVMISSVLLGTATAQPDSRVDPSPEERVQAASRTATTGPAATPVSQEADASADTSADTERTAVGSEKSNVDKDSSSGSYYPYSAGTVGDDPAEPTSTAVPADAGDKAQGPTDQWGDGADGDGYLSLAELTKAAPALAAHFDDMDVDGDKKLTRGEFRTWHESRKARMDADDESKSSTVDGTHGRTTPPDDGGP